MAGRPSRPVDESKILQDSRWTRDTIRKTVLKHVRGEECNGAERSLLERMQGVLLKDYAQNYWPEFARYWKVIDLWRDGLAPQQILERFPVDEHGNRRIGLKTIERYIQAQRRVDVVEWSFRSEDRTELLRLCERIGVSEQSGYNWVREFRAFVSARYAAECFVVECDNTCRSRGGDGRTPNIDLKNFAANQCVHTRALTAFNRYGELQLEQTQLQRSVDTDLGHGGKHPASWSALPGIRSYTTPEGRRALSAAAAAPSVPGATAAA